MDKRSIAIFDSGVGSISVIKALKTRLSNENILYLADRKHHPYGLKDQRELRAIISKTIDYLLRYEPKIIILASITPSLTILDNLRIDKEIPIFGIYLPIEEAVKVERIAIIGTRTLLDSNRIDELIKQHITRAEFRKINASNIIEKIEYGMDVDDEISEMDIDADLAILASTHLSLIKDKFELLHKDVKFIDGIANTVEQVRSYLYNRYMLANNGSDLIRILVSKDLTSFKVRVSNLLRDYNLTFESIELSF